MATNIPFLQAVLDDPDFRAGTPHHQLHRDAPASCSRPRSSADRGTKLLTYLADVTINQPYGARPVSVDPVSKLPPVGPAPGAAGRIAPAPARRSGPAEFARQLRAQTPVAVTDTTFRDAHQSLLATRVRTRDLLNVRRPRRQDHAGAAVA